MADEREGWGLHEYVASNEAVPAELRPDRIAVMCVGNRLMCLMTLRSWTWAA